MLAIIAAIAMAQSAPPPPGAVCAQARFGRSSKISFVATPQRFASFQQRRNNAGIRGSEIVAASCVTTWTTERTRGLCSVFSDPAADFSKTIESIIGVNGAELCDAAREVVPG
jgi:hypothetical protein